MDSFAKGGDKRYLSFVKRGQGRFKNTLPIVGC